MGKGNRRNQPESERRRPIRIMIHHECSEEGEQERQRRRRQHDEALDRTAGPRPGRQMDDAGGSHGGKGEEHAGSTLEVIGRAGDDEAKARREGGKPGDTR